MPTLYIKGETGATLGPARVSFADDLHAVQANAVWRVLGVDELRWMAETIDLNDAETIIPDVGQKISLYLDEVRIFHGHAVEPELRNYGVRVGVFGPTWWLQRQDVVSADLDDEGTSGERPILRFASGDLGDHIESLIELAEQGYGMPTWVGDLSTFYDIPTVSFSLSSLATVLARLVQWCGDAVPWWDHTALGGTVQAATATTVQLDGTASADDDRYNGLEIELRSGAGAGETRVISDYDGATKTATISTAWTTTPSNGDSYVVEIPCRLRVTRRDDAPERTFTVGTDEVSDGLSFRQRIEYETKQVSIPYVDRNPTTGLARWQLQEAGTFERGKRQIVPVSGPELSDFLPFDDFDSYVLSLASPTSGLNAFLFARDTQLAAAKDAGLAAALSTAGGTFSYATSTSQLPTANAVSYTVPAPRILKADGSTAVLTGKNLIAGERPPDWLANDAGFVVEEVTITGFYVYEFVEQQRISGTNTVFALPNWAFNLAWDLFSGDVGGIRGSDFNNRTVYELYAKSFQLQAYLINTAAAGTKYKPWAYDFLNPPAGLAANLLAASDWVPWEGVIPFQMEPLQAIQPLGEKHNVAGLLTSAATAGALPKAYSLDLHSGEASIQLGVPARADYRTLVGRTERNPQDNIVEL